MKLLNPYNDLERFMDYWKDSPTEMSVFLGRVIGRLGYKNYHDLFQSIGASYFALQNICSRIDHLYIFYDRTIGGIKGQLLKKMVEIEINTDFDDPVVRIHDLSGNHNNIRVMLLRYKLEGISHYSLRYFANTNEEWTGFLKTAWGRTEFPSFMAVAERTGNERIKQLTNSDFWNFRRPIECLNGVVVYPDAHGFFDIHETKSVADLILLASNLAGFVE